MLHLVDDIIQDCETKKTGDTVNNFGRGVGCWELSILWVAGTMLVWLACVGLLQTIAT